MYCKVLPEVIRPSAHLPPTQHEISGEILCPGLRRQQRGELKAITPLIYAVEHNKMTH